jgi:hypothetical protein
VLYRRAQVQAVVIDSITRGDPDIREILSLSSSDPTTNWVSEKVVEKPEPAKVDVAGFELLTRSRFIDLRRWREWEASPDRRGNAFLRERLTVKRLDKSESGRRMTLRYPVRGHDLQIRVTNSNIPRTIWHVTSLIDHHGEQRDLYEVELDLSQVPVFELVTVQLEFLVPVPVVGGRVDFETYFKTDLASIWILFPVDRPYRNYSLLHYPASRDKPPELMQARFTIDHPYGSLIGWSVVNPEINAVYECRWTTD